MKKPTINKDYILAILIFGVVIGGCVMFFIEFTSEIETLSKEIANGLLRSLF